MRGSLSAYQLRTGLAELRRILTTSAGCHHAGEVVPFCPEAVDGATRALAEICRKAELWETLVATHRARRLAGEVALTPAQQDRVVRGVLFAVEALERPRADREVPLTDTGCLGWR